MRWRRPSIRTNAPTQSEAKISGRSRRRPYRLAVVRQSPLRSREENTEKSSGSSWRRAYPLGVASPPPIDPDFLAHLQARVRELGAEQVAGAIDRLAPAPARNSTLAHAASLPASDRQAA
jgi:hypothetical protein